MKTRDLTLEQYRYRMAKAGFTTQGILGYWTLPGISMLVSDLNAGDNRRAKLRYMLRKLKHEQERREQEARMDEPIMTRREALKLAQLLQLRANDLWRERDRLTDFRYHYAERSAKSGFSDECWASDAYQRMGADIERLADRAARCEQRSTELWNTPYLADEPCECGPNPDAPACRPCSARADLEPMPY